MAEQENVDTSYGDIYPVNSKIQGETFEKIKEFIAPRMRQMIKQVSYTMKVEYFSESSYKTGNLSTEEK